jgi:hypothetical protein
MIELLQMRSINNERILNLRAIARILESNRFEEAFERASNKERQNVYIIIFNSNKDLLNSWIKNTLNEKNINELHDEAYRLGIKNPTRLSKNELQWEISKRI